MYGSPLEYVDRFKYLGVTVIAGSSFSTSHLKPLIKFRSAANTVLNVHQKPSEQILMKMLYATCVPHLTYASDVIQYLSGQMQQLNGSWKTARFLAVEVVAAGIERHQGRLPLGWVIWI